MRRPLVAVLFAVGVLVTGCSGSEQSEAERKSFEWGHDVAAHAVFRGRRRRRCKLSRHHVLRRWSQATDEDDPEGIAGRSERGLTVAEVDYDAFKSGCMSTYGFPMKEDGSYG